MPRLYRPHIPLSVRCAVAENALLKLPLVAFLVPATPLGERLAGLLALLAEKLGCAVEDLRLDHDPPLGARPQQRRGLGRKTYYIPDANDPEHLFYRPHGTQFAGSHDVKTRVRGDHGQFSDIALIKRERRRGRPPKPKAKIPARTMESQCNSIASPPKRWPKRPFPKRSKR